MAKSKPLPWWADSDSPPTPGAYRAGPYMVPYTSLQSVEGEPWPTHGVFVERLQTLLREYEAICDLAGVQFPVRSGYRLQGPHARGYALDISPAGGVSVAMMAAFARMRREKKDSALIGIGQNPEWLHIDIRPRTMRINWKVTNPERAW